MYMDGVVTNISARCLGVNWNCIAFFVGSICEVSACMEGAREGQQWVNMGDDRSNTTVCYR